jgi:hypothetical protein
LTSATRGPGAGAVRDCGPPGQRWLVGSLRDPTSAKAAAAYLVLTLVATWPLVLGLGRDVAWDLGDPVLVMWILSWDCEQLLRILSGDFARIATFFDGNIFYPSPLTLAYSDHLVAQAIQIFPVWVATGNPILSYNLLFISTFVLSGLGMYLLMRELTGNSTAAFAAGLLFAFAPYRLPQSSHLQILSSQWMPFVFYGITRYIERRRLRPLAGAVIALVLQNLSSGYHLLYFPPFVAAYVVWEVARRHLWRDRRMWMELGGAGVVVAAATAPFLLPYAAMRRVWQILRPFTEVSQSSADVYSYATAFSGQRIWGDILQAFPKPEAELFPGLVPLWLAVIGIAWRRREMAREATPSAKSLAPRWLVWLLTAVAVAHAVAAIAVLVSRRIVYDLGWFELQMSNANQLLLRAVVAAALVLLVSPHARSSFRAFMRDRGFPVAGLLAAAWLSLGPVPQAQGRLVEIAAPYRVLYDHVPGFNGLRVPARFAMIEALLLAMLAGYGAHALSRSRPGIVVLGAAGVFFFLEATHVPFTTNGMAPIRGYATPEARVYRPARAPAVYREMERQPSGSVLVEFPFGQPDYDLRAMFYSTVHWHALVNGYSGVFPPHYGLLTSAFSEMPRHPDVSLDALRMSGATHAIVHEAAYLDSEGTDTSALLRNAGAVEILRDGSDVLFRLPR